MGGAPRGGGGAVPLPHGTSLLKLWATRLSPRALGSLWAAEEPVAAPCPVRVRGRSAPCCAGPGVTRPLSRVPRRKEPACGRPIPLSRALARLLLGCWGPERIWAPGGHSQQSARYAHGHRPLAEPAALPLVVLTAPSVCRFPGLCRGGRGAVGGSGARPLQQCWPPRRWWVPPGFLTP